MTIKPNACYYEDTTVRMALWSTRLKQSNLDGMIPYNEAVTVYLTTA